MMANVMMERMGMPGMGTGMTSMGGTAGAMAPNMMMVPRCTFKMEKSQTGMSITCTCDDAMACSMMQNLCTMMSGSMVSCCMMMNGMMVCCCNLMMGMCTTETTKQGCKITCTSGDAKCCQMIQSCCDCMNAMLQAGCTCCVMMNNTPVCCGCAK
jgi:hypothetical protein